MPIDPAHDPTKLPGGLPIPVDDGAASHLIGAALPPIALDSTAGTRIRLSEIVTQGRRGAVLFFYPRTGVPCQPPSLGFQGEEWDSIPGARGCTPQSCGFSDAHAEFAAYGFDVFGVSTNSTAHQLEFRSRMRVPFHFLSDSSLELVRAMRLPTFDFPVESGGPNTLIHRMGWLVEPDPLGMCRVRMVWYPVFPPDRHARNVLDWLRAREQK